MSGLSPSEALEVAATHYAKREERGTTHGYGVTSSRTPAVCGCLICIATGRLVRTLNDEQETPAWARELMSTVKGPLEPAPAKPPTAKKAVKK